MCAVSWDKYTHINIVLPRKNTLVHRHTVYPKTYAHGFCFAVLCCGYTLADFPISIRLTSLALWQSNDCPSASKATLMNMDKYFMWIHYERLHNHNKAKHNKTVCIFLGIYCTICIFHTCYCVSERQNCSYIYINIYTVILWIIVFLSSTTLLVPPDLQNYQKPLCAI